MIVAWIQGEGCSVPGSSRSLVPQHLKPSVALLCTWDLPSPVQALGLKASAEMQEPHVYQTLRDAQHLAQGQAGTAGFQRIVYEIDE